MHNAKVEAIELKTLWTMQKKEIRETFTYMHNAKRHNKYIQKFKKLHSLFAQGKNWGNKMKHVALRAQCKKGGNRN